LTLRVQHSAGMQNRSIRKSKERCQFVGQRIPGDARRAAREFARLARMRCIKAREARRDAIVEGSKSPKGRNAGREGFESALRPRASAIVATTVAAFDWERRRFARERNSQVNCSSSLDPSVDSRLALHVRQP
jgi:hypothetical protein